MNANELKVGDQVLFVASRDKDPEVLRVIKITKAMFVVDRPMTPVLPAPYRFSRHLSTEWNGPDKPYRSYYEPYKTGKYSPYRYFKVYPFTEEMHAVLQAEADKTRKRQEEQRIERDRKEAEREAEHLRQLEEVRIACNAPMGFPMCRCQDTMPDGSRMYVIDVPVKPEHKERKKDWERLIIRCWDVEDYEWRFETKISKVKSAYTYCNGDSCSFSSVSTSRYDTDHDAVWEAVRRQYHSW